MALAFNHAPKILYWRDQPEVWRRIASFVQPAGFVSGRLAGLKGRDAFMDRTYLVFSGFGSSEHAVWDDELLSRFDLTTEKLPRIVEPWDIIGTVQPEWAEQLGIAAGTPIAGEDFYRALLRIWLGDNPVQADLKKALLGDKP